ncbi:Flp pilus assembly protein CpaB [Anaerolineales bacterium HSG6]|nr:Flp pilus assembly protein CpaB [Anaerolineales bacterium HSG6]MDM8530371.1 Flp pilus assembly protein CpaB [Anaerolineales bacterium HSG25]
MQRNRLLLIVAVVLTLAVVGVGVYVVVFSDGLDSLIGSVEPPPAADAPPTPTPEIPLREVIVALQPIARGAPFVAGSIGRRSWPESSVLPPGVIDQEVETIGKVAKTDIVQGQLILRDMLADPGASGEASLQIPLGRVAVAFPINRQSSVAFAIQPGDTVDILVTAFFLDVDEEFQTLLPNKVRFLIPRQEFQEEFGTVLAGVDLLEELDEGRTEIYGDGEQAVTAIIQGSGIPIPRRAAQLTVQAAKVIKVGPWIEPPPPPPPAEGEEPLPPTPNVPDIATLAVTPQDALVLLWLRQSGIGTEMALRAANEENADHLTEAVTLQYMLTRFSIAVPPKIDAIMVAEPKSIDQLLIDLDSLDLTPADLTSLQQIRDKPNSGQ